MPEEITITDEETIKTRDKGIEDAREQARERELGILGGLTVKPRESGESRSHLLEAPSRLV